MHELSITQSILQIVNAHAEKAGANRIASIHLVIGDLTSFVDESIQYYWDIVSQDTPAQGAVIHFKRIPARLECSVCKAVYQLAAMNTQYTCTQCGGDQLTVAGGNEFYVEAIDVEMERIL